MSQVTKSATLPKNWASAQLLSSRGSSPRHYWLLVAALLVNALISVLFFFVVRDREQELLQTEVERRGRLHARAVQAAINRNMAALDALAGLFSAYGVPDRNAFRTFIESGELLTEDLQALEWIPRVTDAQRERFEVLARETWRPGFQFTEVDTHGKLVRAAGRAEYFPVYYVEPLRGNAAAVGFDLVSNPTRKEALLRARDSGEMVTTGRIRLVQEPGTQFGILIFRPLYRPGSPQQTVTGRRTSLHGYALGVVRLGDMLHSALGKTRPEGLEYSLADESAPAAERVLHQSEAWTDETAGPLRMRVELTIPGRTWRLSFRPTLELVAAFGPTRAREMLLGGLTYTVILATFLGFYFVRLVRHSREIERLAEHLQHLIVELEAKNAELEQYAYTVSHDLQAPLVTIQGFLNLLKEDLSAGDAERIEQDMARISSATYSMKQLLSELLDLAHVGHVRNPPETVSLAKLTSEVVELLGVQIAEGGVEIEIDPNMGVVVGDRLRLLELFQNLIENAVKFMGDQPTPRVTIGARQDDEGIVYFVRDNGVGIDPRFHEKVFDLFQRLNPSLDGTGVGLTLVKRIVEWHGGQVWVESEGPGRGATFCFRLVAYRA